MAHRCIYASAATSLPAVLGGPGGGDGGREGLVPGVSAVEENGLYYYRYHCLIGTTLYKCNASLVVYSTVLT